MQVSTQELYNIEPKELASMRYDEALKFMLKKLDSKFSNVVDASFAKGLPYSKLTELEKEMRYIQKAIKMKQTQLDEMGIKA